MGIDTNQLKEAEGSDEATNQAVMSALSGSSRIRMQGAVFIVESATDDAIIGTFSLPARGGSPAMTEGEFRAVFRKK